MNLLGPFDRNVGLTTKCTMVKVTANVEENEPLSQARVNMTNKKKKKTLVECVTKNSRTLIFLTDILEILYRAASKICSGCLSSTPIPLLLIETLLSRLKITLKQPARSCFERAQCLLPDH